MNKNFEPHEAQLDQAEFNLLYRNYHEFEILDHLYNAAMDELCMRLNVLNEEFAVMYERSPIHHIESRVKSTRSIVAKLRRKGVPVTLQSARQNINDLAGIRVVCCYIDDVYAVEEMLMRQKDIELVKRQDYIAQPNYNGYRSLHLDMRVPIHLSDRTEHVMVEIQLRSVAMDFWASLEHDLRYKMEEGALPIGLDEEMLSCANEIAAIDIRMQEMYKRITGMKPKEKTDELIREIG